MSKRWSAAACVISFALGCFVAGAAATSRVELDAGLAAFIEKIQSSEAQLRKSPAYGSEAEQVGGYMHLARSIMRALEEGVLQDEDYPYFRILDFWRREGGDNSDQRYAFSPLRGSESYRVWGNLGSARRVELQLYAGLPWTGKGRSAGYLPFEDIEIAEDGSFDILVSAQRDDGASTWIENPSDTTTVFVRHIFDEWSDDPATGHVHIDRVGYEGKRRPEATAAETAAKFVRAAQILEEAATIWPEFVQRSYVHARPKNEPVSLMDTYPLGGAKGRWMSSGYFELPPGKALLLKTWPTQAKYQAIQLTDMWFSSLEYANQVSSLTSRQSKKSPDGAYYTVVSREDPGHANWLDTGGLARGVFLLRYDGVMGEIPKKLFPSAELVEVASLPERIPGFEPVSEAEREQTRRARREHVQLRFGR